MKTIQFKLEEVHVLKGIIELGNSQYDNNFTEIASYILSKIRIEIFHFDKKEIQVLRSYCANWINNNEEMLDSLKEKYLNKSNLKYNNISELERKQMQKIDLVFSIKTKLFQKKYITFKYVLENIDKVNKDKD